MKAKFTTNKFDASVSVEFDAESPDFDNYETVRKTRTFSCPRAGGYVIEHIGNGNTAQVCDKLSSRGSTLRCSGSDKLPELIRREYQAMVRANKKAEA